MKRQNPDPNPAVGVRVAEKRTLMTTEKHGKCWALVLAWRCSYKGEETGSSWR